MTRPSGASPSCTPRRSSSSATTKPRSGSAACTHSNGSPRTTPSTGRPSSTSSAPTCACHSPPAPTGTPAAEATEKPGEPAAETAPKTDALGDTWQQERQVRLTAQRILADHLRDDRAADQRSAGPPSPRFWPDIRIDLVGATLINFRIKNGVMTEARFGGADFSGFTDFTGAAFNGDTSFNRATFSSVTRFDTATFGGDAVFNYATFMDAATFVQTTFSGGIAGSSGRPSAAPPHSREPRLAALPGSTARRSAAVPTSPRRPSGALRVAFLFSRSRVLSPDAEHVWPTGWCLEPDGSGGYTVVRVGRKVT